MAQAHRIREAHRINGTGLNNTGLNSTGLNNTGLSPRIGSEISNSSLMVRWLRGLFGPDVAPSRQIDDGIEVLESADETTLRVRVDPRHGTPSEAVLHWLDDGVLEVRLRHRH